jgi:hypothetical protein
MSHNPMGLRGQLQGYLYLLPVHEFFEYQLIYLFSDAVSFESTKRQKYRMIVNIDLARMWKEVGST